MRKLSLRYNRILISEVFDEFSDKFDVVDQKFVPPNALV